MSESMIDRANAAMRAGAYAVRRSPYALSWHIAAPCGWINDPNGLVRHGGRYHVFYQYHPFSAQWGPMYWGHASSADLAFWRHEPVALAPDQPYEKGCFSGSAVDDHGTLTLIYTAHDDDNPIKETQCVARSFDGGKTFVKSPLNPVIAHPPAGCDTDFRDPKVWRQDGLWRLVAGSRHNGRGCAVLYTSADLERWQSRGILAESDGTLGDMWECPSFCRVDGQDVLIVSPMNMPGHKNIALFGRFDSSSGRMTLSHWQELDWGEDFYAAQILEDGDRALLFAWMDMWGREHPTAKDGWAGALTLPRELHMKNGRLIQVPAPELEKLRERKVIDGEGPASLESFHETASELYIRDMRGTLTLSDPDGVLMEIRVLPGHAELILPDGQIRPAALSPDAPNALRVFLDRCSVECFAGGGEVCFTQRVYPRDGKLNLTLNGESQIDAWTLKPAFQEGLC